ncbi:hypothetical protein QTP88_007789 [Uroleucon formosanum]
MILLNVKTIYVICDDDDGPEEPVPQTAIDCKSDWRYESRGGQIDQSIETIVAITTAMTITIESNRIQHSS